MSDRPSTRGAEGGSATVLVAGVCVLVLVLGVAAIASSAASQASARARTAADLSALAAATARLNLLLGGPAADPCALASALAADNGAVLTSCAHDGAVTVTVAVSVRLTDAMTPLGGLQAATAVARAGPAP